MNQALFSAAEIAALLAEPGQPPLTPTDEQRQVIESPIHGSTLVIAGAGSGKTETIANRVVWLVANGFFAPNEILGLTFTRKAAGELAERVRGRLLLFAERAMQAPLEREQATKVHELHEQLTRTLDLPEVSTYNAFASSLVQEFGSGQGIGGQLIDESVAWGIARDIVIGSTDPALASLGMSVQQLTQHVLTLSRDIADHLSDAETVRQALFAFDRVTALPYNEAALEKGVADGKVYANIAQQAETFAHTRVIVGLAERYAEEKARRGVLEFSDQVALALRALGASAASVPLLRHRHRVVLLDEVQDTSVSQTRLLSTIFAGHHVMAVGDPHQSIYGWRGASTESLSGFHSAFAGETSDQTRTLTLSTSWRNAVSVLQVANRAAMPLRREATVRVPTLSARPGAQQGLVESRYEETVADEAQAVASWMKQRRDEYRAQRDGEAPTAAVIFRKRKDMPLFAEAIRELGIPARIVGIGGLLETPEVSDVLSTLRCVWYADASSELLRVLTGPRFAVGPADIAGLKQAARWFSQRDYRHQRIDAAEYSVGVLETLDRDITLVDVLDLVGTLPEGHQSIKMISTVGMTRLREAHTMLRQLRSLIGGDVIELIRATVDELRLDIELEAHEKLTADTNAHARENLHSFIEAVRGFTQVSQDRSLRAVLEWLEHSEREDALPAFVPPPEPGTVQLITVHSSKGLEWDLVAVPRQSAGEFPSSPRSTRGELAAGTIPDVCRGDARSRPVGAWGEAETQHEARGAIDEYQAAQARLFAEEELRLVYVAYTRAKTALLLTGSFWGTRKTSLPPSSPLKALSGEYEATYASGYPEGEPVDATKLLDAPPAESAYAEAPLQSEPRTMQWPLDPLGIRRKRVEEAAQLVRETPPLVTPEIELLLAEAQQRAHHQAEIDLRRINASGFHDFVHDPLAARDLMLRPLPQKPYNRTRVGNLFHEWVERRTTTAIGTAMQLSIDDAIEAPINNDERDELQRLIDSFERSRWAHRQPISVEEQITIPFAGRRVVCKLDAVYEAKGRIEIVDWKTGRTPKSKAEREQRFLQLDLYRVAYALHRNIDPETIQASLFYVDSETELQHDTPHSLEALEALWIEAYGQLEAG